MSLVMKPTQYDTFCQELLTKSINIYEKLTITSHMFVGCVQGPACLYTDAIPNKQELALISLTLIGDHIMTKVVAHYNKDLIIICSNIRDPPPLHLTSCLTYKCMKFPDHLLEQLMRIKIVEPVVWNAIGHTLEILHEAKMREHNAYHEYSEDDGFS